LELAFMLLLRWMIGIGCAIALAFFTLVMVVGKGMRSAYQSGASTTDVLRESAIYGVPVLLIAMLVSVFMPQARGYLHVVAAGVVLAVIGCGFIIADAPGEGAVYLSFFALWLLYYGLAAWGRG
jgi:hypothetical protein